jgi:hypothetical protein
VDLQSDVSRHSPAPSGAEQESPIARLNSMSSSILRAKVAVAARPMIAMIDNLNIC